MPPTEAATEAIALTVNGSERRVGAGTTISELLQSLDVDPRMVVVEHNREIIRDRELLPQRVLRAGDVIEIVHFVGGG